MRLVLLLTALLAFQGAAASEFDEMKALADQGMAAAQFNLGTMYDNRRGVPENGAEAVKWYGKAAGQGYADAQYNLGLMYATGSGVLKSKIRAYVWWSMSKIQGTLRAESALDSLKPRMDAQQIVQAQALASQCYESAYKECD